MLLTRTLLASTVERTGQARVQSRKQERLVCEHLYMLIRLHGHDFKAISRGVINKKRLLPMTISLDTPISIK